MADTRVLQCNSCGGVYRTLQDDGLAYYHACPSDRVETPATFDDAGKQIGAEVRAPIPNRRDENVVVTDRATNAVGIKAEGAGVTPVTDPAVLARFGLKA
jgi:phage tail sheath gpL-like